ncbi:hypothetical protein E2C01_054914 [Portunus trituberculatus]|uniref:Uncharacterized protein n=1 Tax=Portunus trituberculatus TaxID=210409 RepID=A0A5B7GTX3_PORTR|nr:hypothetical protein [Portunus trituberculatus]
MTIEYPSPHNTVWLFDYFDSVARVITGHLNGPPHDIGVIPDQPEHAFIAEHYFLHVYRCSLFVYPAEIQMLLLHSLH